MNDMINFLDRGHVDALMLPDVTAAFDTVYLSISIMLDVFEKTFWCLGFCP